MPSAPPPIEDPRVTRSRARIIEAARACFAEHGYRVTSLEQIGSRAGVTKRTIYNIYGDKETLFREAIEGSVQIAGAFISDLVSQIHDLADPDDDLPPLAVRLSRDVLGGPVVPLRRLVAREAETFPDLVLRYRAGAPEAVLRALTGALQELDARGLLTVEDPEVAAEQFAFLVLGAELDRRMLGAPAAPTERTDQRAVQGARTFLRAHRRVR